MLVCSFRDLHLYGRVVHLQPMSRVTMAGRVSVSRLATAASDSRFYVGRVLKG